MRSYPHRKISVATVLITGVTSGLVGLVVIRNCRDIVVAVSTTPIMSRGLLRGMIGRRLRIDVVSVVAAPVRRLIAGIMYRIIWDRLIRETTGRW